MNDLDESSVDAVARIMARRWGFTTTIDHGGRLPYRVDASLGEFHHIRISGTDLADLVRTCVKFCDEIDGVKA